MNITIQPISAKSYNNVSMKGKREDLIARLRETARQKWNWDHPLQRIDKTTASEELQQEVASKLRAKRIFAKIFPKKV